MPDQAMPDFAERVQRAVKSGDRLAERLASQGEPAIEQTDLAEKLDLLEADR